MAKNLADFGITSGFGFGIMFLLLGAFLGALTSGSQSANAVSNIISIFGNQFTTTGLFAVIVVIVLALFVYEIYENRKAILK